MTTEHQAHNMSGKNDDVAVEQPEKRSIMIYVKSFYPIFCIETMVYTIAFAL
jgi:hypothetical protein